MPDRTRVGHHDGDDERTRFRREGRQRGNGRTDGRTGASAAATSGPSSSVDGEISALGLRAADGSTVGVLLCNLSRGERRFSLQLSSLPRRSIVRARAVPIDADHESLTEDPLPAATPADGRVELPTTLAPLTTKRILLDLD